MLILAVAANTSFAGFPRLAALLAADGFLPRQLTGLGDRLVFTNGILLLSIATGILIVVFGGDTHALIPLFAVVYSWPSPYRRPAWSSTGGATGEKDGS